MKFRKGDLVLYKSAYGKEILGIVIGTNEDWWVAGNCIDVDNIIMSIDDVISIVRRKEVLNWWKYIK